MFEMFEYEYKTILRQLIILGLCSLFNSEIKRWFFYRFLVLSVYICIYKYIQCIIVFSRYTNLSRHIIILRYLHRNEKSRYGKHAVLSCLQYLCRYNLGTYLQSRLFTYRSIKVMLPTSRYIIYYNFQFLHVYL